MTDEPTGNDYPLLPVLLDGAEKTFANAEQLFNEGRLLGEAGATARALLLHQISLEECSKLDSLGAWGTSLVLGLEVDQKKVLGALTRHKAKNMLNAYMLEVSDAELEARAAGDWEKASDLFRETQAAFHASSNDAKNGALYVDWIDGAFVAPAERISTAMLADITERNATFLGFAFNNLKTLRRLAAGPDNTKTLMAGFVEEAEKLRDERPADLVERMDALLAALFEKALSKPAGT